VPELHNRVKETGCTIPGCLKREDRIHLLAGRAKGAETLSAGKMLRASVSLEIFFLQAIKTQVSWLKKS
jgi:hypothetical protein